MQSKSIAWTVKAELFENESTRSFFCGTTRREHDIARVLYFGRLIHHAEGIVDDLVIAYPACENNANINSNAFIKLKLKSVGSN